MSRINGLFHSFSSDPLNPANPCSCSLSLDLQSGGYGVKYIQDNKEALPQMSTASNPSLRPIQPRPEPIPNQRDGPLRFYHPAEEAFARVLDFARQRRH
jgi:hypothetical protein